MAGLRERPDTAGDSGSLLLRRREGGADGRAGQGAPGHTRRVQLPAGAGDRGAASTRPEGQPEEEAHRRRRSYTRRAGQAGHGKGAGGAGGHRRGQGTGEPRLGAGPHTRPDTGRRGENRGPGRRLRGEAPDKQGEASLQGGRGRSSIPEHHVPVRHGVAVWSDARTTGRGPAADGLRRGRGAAGRSE